jgi:hypothetical protein
LLGGRTITLSYGDAGRGRLESRLRAAVASRAWEGWQVRGWPALTILRGAVVVEDGELRGQPGMGAFVPRKLDADVLARPAF